MLGFRRYIVIFPFCISIAFLLASCNQSKQSQCQRLIELVNKQNELVQKNKGTKADTTLQLATDLDKVTKEMAETKFGDPQLAGFQSRLVQSSQTISQEIAKAGNALSSATTAEVTPAGRTKVESAKKDIEAALKKATVAANQSDDIAQELNQYCKKPES